jgi:hypothetical protein
MYLKTSPQATTNEVANSLPWHGRGDWRVPGFRLTRFHADNGAETPGTYPGLDRFGRVVRQMWVDDGFTENSGSSTVPNVPPIVSTAYTYQTASNRTGAFDARPKSQKPLSNMPAYDGLHRLVGCVGTVQTFEATSADLGCVASAFSGEETQVSLIGELDVVSGATVELVDNFNNAAGKSAEVVYARGLTVQPGATLVTNGIKVVTRNALIQGTVDDPANICVVPDLPDPDVNGDGVVNGIDLAFVLTYWGTTAPIADLDDDGIVGGSDMAIVLNGWTG